MRWHPICPPSIVRKPDALNMLVVKTPEIVFNLEYSQHINLLFLLLLLSLFYFQYTERLNNFGEMICEIEQHPWHAESEK